MKTDILIYSVITHKVIVTSMPDQKTNLLLCSYTEVILKDISCDKLTFAGKGELTFNTPGYNIRKQPSQFDPKRMLVAVNIPTLSAAAKLSPIRNDNFIAKLACY